MTSFEARIHLSVTDDLQLMQELLELLHQEETALLADNFIEIEDLARLKSDVILKLQQSNVDRLSAFSNINQNQPTDSFVSWLNNQKDQSLANVWAELMLLTGKAKEINTTNGLLLNQLVIRNQRLLSFFKSDSQENLYGPNGLNASKSARQRIKG